MIRNSTRWSSGPCIPTWICTSPKRGCAKPGRSEVWLSPIFGRASMHRAPMPSERTSANQPLLGALLPPSVPLSNNVYQAGFDASWELDVFGGRRRTVEAADAGIASAVYSQQDVQVTLVAEVARNYVEARSFQRRLAIARENIEAQQDSCRSGQRPFPARPHQQSRCGASRHRFGPDRSPGSNTRNRAPNVDSSPWRAPRTTAGSAADGIVDCSADPVARPRRCLLGCRPICFAGGRTSAVAERQLAAATAQIGVATADLFPKFSLTGDVGLQSVSASDLFTAGSRFWSVGPTVQWRIFDAGRIRANIRVQNAKQEQALATYEKTVLTSFEDVENALVAYAKEQTRNVSLEEAVKSKPELARDIPSTLRQRPDQLHQRARCRTLAVSDPG